MFSCVALVLATAAAGMIAGARGPVFLAAALAAAVATWRRPWRRPHEHVFLTLDPHSPETAATRLCAALRETCDRILNAQRPALVRIAALSESPSLAPIQLDLNRDGDLEFKASGQRPAPLQRPGLWIAEHPLPLPLPRDRCVTLALRPSCGKRLRVVLAPFDNAPLSRRVWASLLLLLVFGCATDTHWLTAAALGFAFQTGLLAYHGKRAGEYPQIKGP